MLNKLFFLLGIFLILILFVPKKFLHKIIINLSQLSFLPKQKTKNSNYFVQKYIKQANHHTTGGVSKSGIWNEKKNYLSYMDRKHYLYQYPLSKNKNLTYIILYTRKNLYKICAGMRK